MIVVLILIVLFILLEILSYKYQKLYNQIKFLRYFLIFGVFVHEFSHYLACKLTFAPVKKFKVGLKEGYVVHGKSKIPIIGNIFISIAPLIIGTHLLMIMFFWITQSSYHEVLANFYFLDFAQLKTAFLQTINIFQRIDFSSWQFALFLFIGLNILATVAPSSQDLQNIIEAMAVYLVLSVVFNFQALNVVLIQVVIMSLVLLTAAIILLYLYLKIEKLVRTLLVNK